MSNHTNKVKEDLYEIYNQLYPLMTDEKSKGLFHKSITQRFKYNSEEVKAILFEKVENMVATPAKPSKKKVNKFASITTKDQLREYYYKTLAPLFNPQIDEKIARKIETSITLEELKYLYKIISPIAIKKSQKKKEVMRLLKNYFDDEVRTNEMIKKL